MAETIKITAKSRAKTGTAECRRLRREGRVPANIYGHRQDPVAISLNEDDIRTLLTGGAKVLDLDVDGTVDKALVKEVQWDTFSTHVQHLDFMRVDPDERVEVDVPIHLRGTAPGVLAGGILEQPVHELTVECMAVNVPDDIVVRVGSLEIGAVVTVADIADVPEGVKILTPAETTIIHIVEPSAEAAAEGEEGGEAGQPEVIGRDKGDEGDN
ncbi:50S ribosomal protein L25 [Maioricimonas sp. JC845]|uniref:50S ribosomal protein L25 n=1 Tax=Maioricimonas sp. JC845 TaxID=3232138 RepID=UPI0034578D9A